MADLGDLTNFLKEGSVADLDWLDVDEQQYRDLDKLPKQNLDISPDLQAMWDHKDQPAGAYLVPNKDKVPSLSALSEAHQGKQAAVEQVIKVARYTLMQTTNLGQLKQALTSRFDTDLITNAKTALASVLRERGLLGRYYVSAADFTNCAQSSKTLTTFVRRYAADARFVVAKSDCQGCIHNSADTCGVFKKKIVLEVPYTPELADAVERSQSAKGKQVQASSTDPRGRIQAAYLAKDVTVAGSVETPKPVVDPARQLRQASAPGKVHLPVFQTEAQRLLASEQAWQPPTPEGKTAGVKTGEDRTAFEVTSLLRREMLKGRSVPELVHALKLSFSVSDLKNTASHWRPLIDQAGLYGTVYATQDSFDDCGVGADFFAKHNPTVKAIVAGGKCNGCIYNKMSRCLIYGRPLAANTETPLTDETVKQVIWEHRLAGKLETGAEKIAWGPTPKEALKAIYRVASQVGKADSTPMRSYVEQAFRGADHGHVTAGLTKREIVKTAARYLNEGLYGTQLGAVLKRQFDPRDIKAAAPELKTILAEQGLQGIYYVDPMVYGDYAKGCEEGARLHRSRLVPYVKLGSKCSSCVLQTKVGYCSKYNKDLVNEPPYADKKAQQQEILSSGQSTEINLASLMQNTKSIVAEFGMKSGIEIDLNPEPTKAAPVSVELGGHKIDL